MVDRKPLVNKIWYLRESADEKSKYEFLLICRFITPTYRDLDSTMLTYKNLFACLSPNEGPKFYEESI